MCYDVETQLRRKLKDAEHDGAPADEIDYLKKKIEQWVEKNGEKAFSKLEHYWTMGFQHQKIPVITNDKPNEIQFFHWGLIPHWVKDKTSAREIAGKCLNARSESIFEKPSFRFAAKDRRCIIPLSGYYEHFWFDRSGKTKVPYFIKRKDNRPLYMAGLWEAWVNKETGEEVNTCTILSTNANRKLSIVHNRNPDDPRMLVILDFEQIDQWLSPFESITDQQHLESMCTPYPEDELEIYPVPQLRGKNGVGDVIEASSPFVYNLIGLPTV